MSRVVIDVDAVTRGGRTAASWFERVALRFSDGAARTVRGEPGRFIIAYESAQLLSSVLSDARLLVPVIAEEGIELDDLRRLARALTDDVRALQLARKLDNVTGRTDAEAASFRAKAATLRGL